MKQARAQRIVKENKQVYNRIAQQFSGTRSHPWGEFTLFEPYVKTGNRVLDIGCGNGRLATFLEKKEIHYTGVDNSMALIDIAKQAHPAATFLVSEATELPFPDQQFDVVCCVATLHHIPSRELRRAAIQEAARVLKPGGYLCLTEWNLWHAQWWGLLVRYSLKKMLGMNSLDWGDVEKPWKNQSGVVQGKRYLHLFSKGSLGKLLKQNNLSLIYHQYTANGIAAPATKGFNLTTVAQKH
ncbi:MAG: class I SAM-dependent methyltransferase [Candidatus Kerfeldbacteria bacterium]|nr:class I SAM-dependent methyltransferase [Candidatus Kerfeldbacteria bacterium]